MRKIIFIASVSFVLGASLAGIAINSPLQNNSYTDVNGEKHEIIDSKDEPP
tara:strand:+ start:263 stop:415 length:153 start_codon:yes stop_codon:yes gene_type:complete